MHKAQRLINHVALVLDASWSMSGRESAVVKVTDAQIKYLAKRSEELSQETRVSVYRFGSKTVECLLFDMDVMRLPSTDSLYRVLRENTALIDATLKSQEDLETTSQLYGDHAFLTFVMTDGDENDSRNPASKLRDKIFNAPVNWSLGFLVPDRRGQQYVERLGVLKDSIAIWDVNSGSGLNDAASKIQQATDNFMVARASGVRGTKSVFNMGADVLNERTVPTTLTPLDSAKYRIFPVNTAVQIRDFAEAQGYHYNAGMAYYQLTKREAIQARKQIVVVEKATDKVYAGQQARHLIGLPDGKEVKVSPQDNPKYDVYVQSTSVNRKLVPGTYVLIIK